MTPGPGLIWCPEHKEWHEDQSRPGFDWMRPGAITPPGKVWSPEHGHLHDVH